MARALAERKAGRHLAEREAGLLACVHCGLCLPACPTYRLLGDENDSPRGRVYLMRALVEGRVEADGAFATHIGQCLGCRACEPACPAGVPFGSLLEAARTEMAAARPARRRMERALFFLIERGAVSRLLYSALRFLRRTPIPAAAGRLLPGRAGLAARLLAATAPADPPATAPARPPGRITPVSHARKSPDTDRADEGASYALLEGCVMDGLFRHVHRASRRALESAGHRERPAPGQGCCGALHAHAGLEEDARRLARRNVAAFEAAGADRVVADAAGCGAALREYGDWLADDPDYAARAAAFSARVRDVMEPLAEPHAAAAPTGLDFPAGADPAAGPDSTAGEALGEGRRSRAASPVRVAYDAPCHLLYGQRVEDAPLTALSRVEGLVVERLPSWRECCGGAGVYNLQHPEISLGVLRRKVEEIRMGGYDAVVTGNPGCAMQLAAGLRAAGIGTPVLHPVELLGPIPRDPTRQERRRRA